MDEVAGIAPNLVEIAQKGRSCATNIAPKSVEITPKSIEIANARVVAELAFRNDGC